MMLRDSARIQQEDARYANRKRECGDPEIQPLYDEDDVRKISRSFEYVAMGEWHELAEDMRVYKGRIVFQGNRMHSASGEL